MSKKYRVLKQIPGAEIGKILRVVQGRYMEEASDGDLCHLESYSTVIGSYFIDNAVTNGFIEEVK